MTKQHNKISPEHCDNYSKANPQPTKKFVEPSVDFPYDEVFLHLDGPLPVLNYENEVAVQTFFKQLTAFVLSPTNNYKKSQRIISIRFLAAVYLLLKKEYDFPSASAFLRICKIRGVKADAFCHMCSRLEKYFNEKE